MEKSMATNAEKIAEKQQSKFAGADDIYLNECCIVVHRITDASDSTTYFIKNAQNMRELREIYGEVRYGK